MSFRRIFLILGCNYYKSLKKHRNICFLVWARHDYCNLIKFLKFKYFSVNGKPAVMQGRKTKDPEADRLAAGK